MKLLKLFLLAILFPTLLLSQKQIPSKPGKGIILLSFNGYKPQKRLWQYPSFDSAKLQAWQEEYIMARIGDLYGEWNVSVTTDEHLFYTYPKRYRIRCVITRDTIRIPVVTWAGLFEIQTAGRAEINSLALGDTSACVVSIAGTGDITRNISDAAAHEIGHTTGLQHQSLWFFGCKIDEYNPGNVRKAPIMGVMYFSINSAWWKGRNSDGIYQDDKAIISKTWIRRIPIKH